MSNNAIIAQDVSAARDGQTVLRGVSLDCSARRIGVIGANGSGKSTLARVLMGLDKPTQGRVRVNGVDVYADRKGALATVGMIFQNPDHQIIFPTCGEELAFGLTQMGVAKSDARARAAAFLQTHNRADWVDRSTHALSQGQRHYLCLMAVLIMQPSVLIFDEPYAGLDMATSLQLHRALDGLEQQVVMITHDLDVLAGFDHVIWMDAGQITAQGAPDDILAQYRLEMSARGQQNA